MAGLRKLTIRMQSLHTLAKAIWPISWQSSSWLQAFDMATKERARGQPRSLLMGRHRTHCSLKMIRYAVENNITMMPCPGHSTHLLQPLDAWLLVPLQRAYSKAVAEHQEDSYHTGATRTLFLEGFAQAQREKYTVQNIKASGRTVGIAPYNPDNVLNQLPTITATATTSAISKTWI